MKMLSSLAAAGLLLASVPSFAEQPYQRPHPLRDPGVNARQHLQGDRIRQGARSGALTGQEARGLMQERRGIRQEEAAYKSDGRLTKDERKDLHQDLNDLSRDIYSEKHDAETRAR